MRAVIVLLVLLLLVARAVAEPAIRVIVHAKNPAARLDKRFVADAFLKKRTRWGNDSAIQAVDLGAKTAVRAKFSSAVLGRTVDAVRRYWAQLVFSGRGVPPPELSSEADVVAYVAAHPGAIGYVSASVELVGAKVVEVE
jgi:ABC-type phosphate transport system substrate-binding protein